MGYAQVSGQSGGQFKILLDRRFSRGTALTKPKRKHADTLSFKAYKRVYLDTRIQLLPLMADERCTLVSNNDHANREISAEKGPLLRAMGQSSVGVVFWGAQKLACLIFFQCSGKAELMYPRQPTNRKNVRIEKSLVLLYKRAQHFRKTQCPQCKPGAQHSAFVKKP
jgi:hypothetical protein